MKKLFSLLIVASISFVSINTYTNAIVNEDETTKVVPYPTVIEEKNNETKQLVSITQSSDSVLTEKDLRNIAKKKHSDKALANFDKFLTKCMVVTGLTFAASHFTPADTYKLGLPDYIHNVIDMIKPTPRPHAQIVYTEGSFPSLAQQSLTNNMFIRHAKENNIHTMAISKPLLEQTSLAATGILALVKCIVKINRALGHDTNPIKFLITDCWA